MTSSEQEYNDSLSMQKAELLKEISEIFVKKFSEGNAAITTHAKIGSDAAIDAIKAEDAEEKEHFNEQARQELQKLLNEYGAFLENKGAKVWDKNSEEAKNARKLCRNIENNFALCRETLENSSDEEFANIAICLTHQVSSSTQKFDNAGQTGDGFPKRRNNSRPRFHSNEPQRGDRREGGFGGRREGGFGERRNSFGGGRREGGFGERREGGFGERREGGFGERRNSFGGGRREGGFGERREGGFGERRNSGFSNRLRSDDFSARREGGFTKSEENNFSGKREGNFGGRREGGFGERREGGFGERRNNFGGERRREGGFGERREGGFGGGRREGGFGGGRREGNSFSDRGERSFRPRSDAGGENRGNFSARPSDSRRGRPSLSSRPRFK